jgi:hypothetical protein
VSGPNRRKGFGERVAPFGEILVRFAAQADDFDVSHAVLRDLGVDKTMREAQQVGVVSACQTFIGGNDDDHHALHGTNGEKRMRKVLDRRRESANQFGHGVGVRLAFLHALLHAAKFRGGHHFHRLSDLGDVFDDADFAFNVAE